MWLKSWSNQDLRITVIRTQQHILGRNPVVDIHYLLFWEVLLTNKQQTNKQTIKKICPHSVSNSRPSRFYHNPLTDWAIVPYSSHYSYQITIVRFLLSWMWLKSWSNQHLRVTVIRIQQDNLDRNPVVDILYLLFWEILLTNKQQTNKQTIKKKLSTQRFELSTLAFLGQCSYWLNWRAVLIWFLLSHYHYQTITIKLTKNFGHTEVRTLDFAFLAQFSYRLNFWAVLI